MKHIHIPTFIVFGISIFCISTEHFDFAITLQYCWVGIFALIILTSYLFMLCMGKNIVLPKDKIMKTVCIVDY